MQESTSPIVKSAIIETIYGAIAKSYPALAPLAEQVVSRKKEELDTRSSSAPRKGVAVPLEITEPAVPTLESGSDAAGGQLEVTTGISEPRRSEESPVEDELRRIANLQFLCLCLVNEYLIPACEKRGIKLSPELQSALLKNMLNQAYRTGLHKKVPLSLDS